MRLAAVLATLLWATGLTAAAEPSASPRAEPDAAEAAAIADSVTLDNVDPAYRALLEAEHRALLRSLSAGETHLSQAVIDHARQRSAQAKAFWEAQGGFDFAVRANQAADIAILAPFSALPRATLERNAAVTEDINHAASRAQQDHALFDADGVAFLFFAAEALGPKLGTAFLDAYGAGEIDRAASLIKASEIGTGRAKAYFSLARPFEAPGNTIALVADRVVAADGTPYRAGGLAFPSGHALVGTTDALLLAAMLPERMLALVARADGYGYSRVVLGVHYPLDVIGSRMIAQRNVARDLADPAYRALLAAARDELRAALETRCGMALPACAAPSEAGDPWADVGRQRRFNRFTLTYGLPQGGGETAMRVPDDAEALLEPLRPDLSAQARRDLLARTALPAVVPLDGGDPFGSWARLNLYDAVLAARP